MHVIEIALLETISPLVLGLGSLAGRQLGSLPPLLEILMSVAAFNNFQPLLLTWRHIRDISQRAEVSYGRDDSNTAMQG